MARGNGLDSEARNVDALARRDLDDLAPRFPSVKPRAEPSRHDERVAHLWSTQSPILSERDTASS